jgi:archaellum component FlaC
VNSWTVWIGRLLFSLVSTAAIAWGVSFWVADYVSDKYARGLDRAVETLTVNVSDLAKTVAEINSNLTTQLISLEKERASLAVEIAKEVQKLQGDQSGQAKDIKLSQETINRIEQRIAEIAENTKIRFTVDGGKTFKPIDGVEGAALLFQAATSAAGGGGGGPVGGDEAFVISPLQVLRLGK